MPREERPISRPHVHACCSKDSSLMSPLSSNTWLNLKEILKISSDLEHNKNDENGISKNMMHTTDLKQKALGRHIGATAYSAINSGVNDVAEEVLHPFGYR